MKNIVILFIPLFITQYAQADIKKDLIECQDIKSDISRLNCFDVIVKKITSTNVTTANQINKKTAKTETISKETTTAKQEVNQPPNNQSTTNFGMEFANQSETVESFIIGEFKGWKKGMKLKLKNGQVWKVLSNRNGYKKMQNPAITISRGFFGSFNAKVEGLNARAKVKRIK